MVPKHRVLMTHDGRKTYILIIEFQGWRICRILWKSKLKIIGIGTIGNGSLPSMKNCFTYKGLTHNQPIISKLIDNGYDIVFH